MRGWFGKLFGGRTAADKSRENPVVQAAVRESALVYDRISLKDLIDEDRRSQLARELYLEINRIANTVKPVTVCRDEFTRTMLLFASYQVLVLDPDSDTDDEGLLAQPGITGALKSRLVALCEKDDDLRSTMYGLTDSREFDDLWPIVERLYWETRWRLGTLNALRIELGDSVDGDDWYQPFLHAACVNQENVYRWKLELPPAFDEEIAREAASTYSVFTDIVISGADDPAAEWREYCRGSRVPMPDFSA